jgi:hypothetical protein
MGYTREDALEIIRSSPLGGRIRAEAFSRLNSGLESPREVIEWFSGEEDEAMDGVAESEMSG